MSLPKVQFWQLLFALWGGTLAAPAALVYTNSFNGEVGIEWSRANTSLTPIGARRFLGEFGNETVTLTLSNLPPHTNVVLAFDLFLIRSWDGNYVHPTDGPDLWLLDVDGENVVRTTFSNIDTGSQRQQAWPGAYPNASFPVHTGAIETNSLGYTYANPNPVAWSSVYRLALDLAHTGTVIRLSFRGANLQNITNESWGLENVSLSVNDGASGVPTMPVGSTTVFDLAGEWRYQQASSLDSTNWFLPEFDDSAWPSGYGLFYSETNNQVFPRTTQLALGRTTYYFRKHFQFEGNPSEVALTFSNKIDDGAVFYLNGREIQRVRMTNGAAVISYSTLATGSPSPESDAINPDVFTQSNGELVGLKRGDNVMAVEVHQSSVNSSDVVFGSALMLHKVAPLGAPWFRWVRQISGTNYNSADGLAVAGDGTVWASGWFVGTTAFGTNLVSSSTLRHDPYLARLSREGVWQRVMVGAGPDDDNGDSISVDREGNVVFSSFHGSSLSFSGATVTSAGGTDANTIKFSPTDSVVWARSGGGSRNDFAFFNVTDAEGGVLVVGRFGTNAQFGPFTLNGSEDAFLVKYDRNGTPLWARGMGGVGLDRAYGVDVDASGNSYVVGDFQGNASFGTTNLIATSSTNAFLAKFGPGGDLIWVRQVGGSGLSSGRAVTVANNGDVVWAGLFTGQIATETFSFSSAGGSDLFSISVDSNGHMVWAKRWGGTGNEGRFGEPRGLSLVRRPEGGLILGVTFSGVTSLDGFNLASTGTNNALVAQVADDGTMQWIKQLVAAGEIWMAKVAAGPRGETYVVGRFDSTIKLDGHSLTSAGNWDSYIACLEPVATTLRIQPEGSKVAIKWISSGNAGLLRKAVPHNLPSFPASFAPGVGISDGEFEVSLDTVGEAGLFRLAPNTGDWISLFDGTNFNAFVGSGSGATPGRGWSVNSGELQTLATTNSEHLETREIFTDFELQWEWKTTATGLSGVFYRDGVEFQLIDDAGYPGLAPNNQMAAVWGQIAPTNRVVLPAGSWNQCRLIVNGQHVEHWLNSRLAVSYELDGSVFANSIAAVPRFRGAVTFGRRRGVPIALQHQNTETSFRNIRVRSLN